MRCFIVEEYWKIKSNQLRLITIPPSCQMHHIFINRQYINCLTVGWSTADGPTLAVRGWRNRFDSLTSIVRRWRNWYGGGMTGTTDCRYWRKFFSRARYFKLKNLRPDKIGWADLIWTHPMKYIMLKRWSSKDRRHTSEVTQWRPMPTNFVPKHHRATVVSLWKGV